MAFGDKMVYLNRIYTKTGDTGETGLGDGSRVSKDCRRIQVIGAVDELNASLGLLIAQAPDYEEAELVRRIQNDLFDLGADLCVPMKDDGKSKSLRITSEYVERLEHAIDRFNEKLAPLNSFVLPGGAVAAAWCHLARTICRRAERELTALLKEETHHIETLKFLNRLSDLLFVMARAANDYGSTDVLWKPGSSNS